jgi:hypothetical protein
MATADTVVALTSGWFGLNGESVKVIAGDVYRGNDPIVKKYPGHFAPQKTERIEQATAAPGEKR